jgi:hypothetical protein
MPTKKQRKTLRIANANANRWQAKGDQHDNDGGEPLQGAAEAAAAAFHDMDELAAVPPPPVPVEAVVGPSGTYSGLRSFQETRAPRVYDSDSEEELPFPSGPVNFKSISFYGAETLRMGKRHPALLRTPHDGDFLENLDFQGFTEEDYHENRLLSGGTSGQDVSLTSELDSFDEMNLQLSDDEIEPRMNVHQSVKDRTSEKGKGLITRRELLKGNESFRAMSSREVPGKSAGLRIVPGEALVELAKKVQCRQCDGEVDVELTNVDLDTALKLTCQICDEVVYELAPATRTNKKLCQATAGIVSHCMNTGGGQADCRKFIANENLPMDLNSHRYYDYANTIGQEMTKMYKDQRGQL